MIYRVVITCEVDADTPQLAAAVTTVRAYDIEIVPKSLRIAPAVTWSSGDLQQDESSSILP
jgi:hypothetical protein